MRINLVILLLLIFRISTAQWLPSPSEIPAYPFIQFKVNRFELVHDNPSYKTLYSKFDSLLLTGRNRIRIVHIGGSHIQADIYTHRIRQELQSFYPGVLGSRGFFFPFKIANTNSPSNLLITFTGDWITCKNTQPEPRFALGISGITSALTSPSGSITVVARYDSLRHYDFNQVRIYCNQTADSGSLRLRSDGLISTRSVDRESKFIQYDLSGYTDTLRLEIRQKDTLHPFEIYGISLENDDPGVTYNSIGVNGAMLKSYLQCGLFGAQLKSLHPDWIIISIGTNEGNTRSFDEPAYRADYIKLLELIRETVPETAILLTVPNDSWLNKRYTNPNTSQIRKTIFELARDNGCGVWDFYSVMGGLNSARIWYDNDLMARDHIHFNKAGYLVKGDLFFNAFLTSWNDPAFNEQSEKNIEQRTKNKEQRPANSRP